MIEKEYILLSLISLEMVKSCFGGKHPLTPIIIVITNNEHLLILSTFQKISPGNLHTFSHLLLIVEGAIISV